MNRDVILISKICKNICRIQIDYSYSYTSKPYNKAKITYSTKIILSSSTIYPPKILKYLLINQ